MSVTLPSGYGIIARKNARTLAFRQREEEQLLQRVRWRNPAATPADVAELLNQDEELYACRVASSHQDLVHVAKELEHDGAVPGVDFVTTCADYKDGFVDGKPAWLTTFLYPSGNPPELEAKMDPEVRAMWESTRVTGVNFVPLESPSSGMER